MALAAPSVVFFLMGIVPNNHQINYNNETIIIVCVGSGGTGAIYWVHFRGIAAPAYAEGASTPQTINVTMNSRIGDRINIFEEMLTTLHFGEGIEDLRYATSLLCHFLASMRYLGQFRRAKAGAAYTQAKPSDMRRSHLCDIHR